MFPIEASCSCEQTFAGTIDVRLSLRIVVEWSKDISLFRIDIPLEFGSPFLVFLACDLAGGVSPLQELQRRLHLPVSGPPHRHHE
jgi:hypothetical protein